jgi:hypothetical protein
MMNLTQGMAIATSLSIAISTPLLFDQKISRANDASMQLAQTQPSAQCQNAIRAAINRIQEGRDINIEASFGTPYDGYPPDRPYAYGFLFSGPATDSVLLSDGFLLNLSTEIINNCQMVSMVAFQADQTDWFRVYGLVRGSVREFECYNPGTGSPGWGYQFCG